MIADRRFVTGLVAALIMVVVFAASARSANAQEGTTSRQATSAEQTQRQQSPVRWDICVAIAVAIGLPCAGAAYAVAQVGSAALGAASEKPEILVRSLTFVALGEGIAVFGLLMSILLWIKL